VNEPAKLTDILESISERFSEGGTLTPAFVVAPAILIVVCAVFALMRRRLRARGRARRSDPRKLFRDLLAALPLEEAQRDALRRLADRAGYKHPAMLLLSPERFDSSLAQSVGEDPTARDVQLFAEARRKLFPATQES